jgi:alcohol dehydrogenase
MTSSVAIFNGVGKPFEHRRVVLPDLAEGQVLVRITACTICGSDVHTHTGRRMSPTPCVLGHEIIGVVSELGPGAPHFDLAGQPFKVDDRITWSLIASCGRCFYCDRGIPQKCISAFKYGHQPLAPGNELSGGLAEHCILVRGTAILRLADSLPDESACPANCATATAWAAIAALGTLDGRVVLVLGAGLLGLTACAIASAGGAQVICSDPNSERSALSTQFGATHTPAPGQLGETVADVTGGHGVDAVVEMSGSNAAFEKAFANIRTGGTIALVGAVFPTTPVALSPELIVRKNLRIAGVHNYAPADLLGAVDFLTTHPQLPFPGLVARWFDLSGADEAFAHAADARHIRVGLRPD